MDMPEGKKEHTYCRYVWSDLFGAFLDKGLTGLKTEFSEFVVFLLAVVDNQFHHSFQMLSKPVTSLSAIKESKRLKNCVHNRPMKHNRTLKKNSWIAQVGVFMKRKAKRTII